MKVMKQFTLEQEIVDLLEKEDNMSALVNDLLYNHFHETPNFRKMRIISRAKEVNRQQVLLKEEEESIKKEMAAFIAEPKNTKPKEIKETGSRAYGKTFTHGGQMEKDQMREDRDEGQ